MTTVDSVVGATVAVVGAGSSGKLAAAGIRPDGVITFWEDSVALAARVATALGLPTNPPAAVDAARRKVRTRELSEQLGIPSPKAQRVRSLDELFAAAARIGFPAVVKPEFGASAAMGCVRVDSLDSIPGIYTLEVNVRMGGGRIHEIVRAVWGVDPVDAQLRSCLDLPPNLTPSRRPQAAVMNTMLHAPASGRLTALPFGPRPAGCLDLQIDVDAAIGDPVDGPDRIFNSMLAEVTVTARDLKQARAMTAALLAAPPVVDPDTSPP